MKSTARLIALMILCSGVWLITSASLGSIVAQHDPLTVTPQYFDTWVVQLASNVDVNAFAARYGYRVLGNIANLPGWYEMQIVNTDKNTRAAQQAAQTLTAAPEVILAYQQAYIYLETYDLPPTDPLYATQWHLNNTGQFGGLAGIDANLEPAWANNFTGAGVHIGIVDDGLQYTHLDLDAPKFIANRSYDYVTLDTDVAPRIDNISCASTPYDDCHGTSVAGVVAAEANNNVCGAGAAYNATISGQRLITEAAVSDSRIAQTLANSFATDKTPMDISNNSWGYKSGGEPGSATRAALENGAVNHNTIYVFAAGNNYPDNAGSSGLVNSRFTIAVGAIHNLGGKSNYSQEGSAVFITAPTSGIGYDGTADVYTTDLLGSNGYGGIGNQVDCTNGFGGTSSSTPLVSGVVALMLQANPTLTWRDVQHILAQTAVQVDAADASWQTNGGGFHTSNKFGFGLVDAHAATQLALTWQTVGAYLNQNQPAVAVNQAIADGAGSGPGNPSYGAETTSSQSVTNATITHLEHVELTMSTNHVASGRELRVQLTSPAGTVSELYDLSTSSVSLSARTLMSVQFWGENPNGQWTIKVQDGTAGNTGTFQTWTLKLYGTSGEVATSTPTPTFTMTYTASVTPTATHTPTATLEPTATNTPDLTTTSTPEPTTTDTLESSITPPIEATPTSTSTFTPTASATPTITYTPTQSYTPSPTATATPNPAELLVNGGFEGDSDGNGIPDDWTGTNLAGDKRKCDTDLKKIAVEGQCAFQFKSSLGENSTLQQMIEVAPLNLSASNILVLSGQISAKGVVNTKVKVRVTYADAELPKGKINVKLTAPTAGYTPLIGTLTLELADTPVVVSVQLQNKGTSGKVYYDALSLTYQTSARLLPLP